MPAPLTLALVCAAVVATRYSHITKLLGAGLVTSNVVPIVVSAITAIDCACSHRLLLICRSPPQRPDYVVGYRLKKVRLILSVGNRERERASRI